MIVRDKKYFKSAIRRRIEDDLKDPWTHCKSHNFASEL